MSALNETQPPRRYSSSRPISDRMRTPPPWARTALPRRFDDARTCPRWVPTRDAIRPNSPGNRRPRSRTSGRHARCDADRRSWRAERGGRAGLHDGPMDFGRNLEETRPQAVIAETIIVAIHGAHRRTELAGVRMRVGLTSHRGHDDRRRRLGRPR